MKSVWSHHATVIDSHREHSEEGAHLKKLKALIFKVTLTRETGMFFLFFSLVSRLVHDKVCSDNTTYVFQRHFQYKLTVFGL